MSAKLHTIQSRADLAEALGISVKAMDFILYKVRPSSLYRTWEIPTKSGGTREIAAPGKPICDWQSQVAAWVGEIYEPRNSTHGYVQGRSIASNARPHVGRHYVLNVDLEDFFPSLHFGRVAGVLAAAPFSVPLNVAQAIAQMCCRDSRLPIGAPSSPVLSNAICYRLDASLQKLAGKWDCTYTRYSDDLTFSTNRAHFPVAIGGIGDDGEPFIGAKLHEVLNSNGFTPNLSKTRLQSNGVSQRVTGLKVNEKLNVDRRYIRRIRAMLHSLESLGADGAQAKYDRVTLAGTRHPQAKPGIADVIEGMIAYTSMVRGPSDDLVVRLRAQLENLRAGRPRDHGVQKPRLNVQGKKAVRILHLSDLHFREKTAWDSDPVFRGLADKLESEMLGELDLLVVTGDIAFSGLQSEYGVAEEWFADLALRLSLPRDRVLFVAGNHDVDRPQVAASLDPFRAELADKPFMGQALRSVLDDVSERHTFTKQFDEFRRFVERFTGESEPELWWRKRFDFRGTTVDVMGLCSALLSQKEREQGQLILGLPIINELKAAASSDADLCLALMHHPLDYISEHDRSAQTELLSWSDLVLRGHWHDEDQAVVQGQGTKHSILAGGCVYESSEYMNSVQRIDIDIASRVARLKVFRWQRRQWIESTDATSGWDPPHQISF